MKALDESFVTAQNKPSFNMLKQATKAKQTYIVKK